MNIIKSNSLIIVLYIYFTSISLLSAPFFNTYLLKNIILISLIIIVLLINKFRFTLKIISFYGVLVLFISLNLLLSQSKSYVIADGLNLLIYSFIPVYLIGQKLVSFVNIKEVWLKFSIVFTFLMPIYYFYRQNGFITYFDIGFLSHLNILILVYSLIEKKKKNLIIFTYLSVNIIILSILGSRMVLVASIVTTLFTFVILSNKKSVKFYLTSLFISAISIWTVNNLVDIIVYVNDVVSKFGLRSRNLSLFISQLEGRLDESSLLSGRDNIYPIIIEYIKENGIFPSGFGVARKLTNGVYYHSHNFFLEITLIFGVIGLLIILGLFLYKIILLITSRKVAENPIKLSFMLILLVSFIVRSLTGTYFVTDVIFLVFLGIVISINPTKEKL